MTGAGGHVFICSCALTKSIIYVFFDLDYGYKEFEKKVARCLIIILFFLLTPLYSLINIT